MRNPLNNEPMFTSFSVELACEACKEAGKSADCKHMLHLVPSWQSSSKHIKLKTIMQVYALFYLIKKISSNNYFFF
jgi:hypothetical protein